VTLVVCAALSAGCSAATPPPTAASTWTPEPDDVTTFAPAPEPDDVTTFVPAPTAPAEQQTQDVTEDVTEDASEDEEGELGDGEPMDWGPEPAELAGVDLADSLVRSAVGTSFGTLTLATCEDIAVQEAGAISWCSADMNGIWAGFEIVLRDDQGHSNISLRGFGAAPQWALAAQAAQRSWVPAADVNPGLVRGGPVPSERVVARLLEENTQGCIDQPSCEAVPRMYRGAASTCYGLLEGAPVRWRLVMHDDVGGHTWHVLDPLPEA